MGTTQWKLAKGKTWRDKLEREHPSHGKIVAIPPRMQPSMGQGKMVIAKPLDIDAIVRKVRKGKLITIGQIRHRLAEQYGVDQACALTTGIFLRIVAEASEEDLRAGNKRVTPYWRVIKNDGKLNDKFPGGGRAQAAKLRKEGIAVRRAEAKRPPCVTDFERYV